MSAAQQAWPADQIERWAVSKLVPYARNARTHSAAQVAQIAASIREWGWTTPVLVDDSRIPSFFCCYISMLAILNPEDDEARRCQGCHRAVTVALLEEYDWVEQVISS